MPNFQLIALIGAIAAVAQEAWDNGQSISGMDYFFPYRLPVTEIGQRQWLQNAARGSFLPKLADLMPAQKEVFLKLQREAEEILSPIP